MKRKSAKPLGEEETFLEVISGLMDPLVFERLAGVPVKSVLDVGCNHAWTLLLMHYLFGCEHLEGMDSSTEAEVVKFMVRHILKQGGTVKDNTLESVWEQITTDGTDAKPQIDDRAIYRRVMNLTYGVLLEEYQCKREKYDLVVLSNVVHYWGEQQARRNLDRIGALIKPTSVLYLRIRDDFEFARMPSPQLLGICREYADRWSLQEYPHAPRKDGARHYSFTNL